MKIPSSLTPQAVLEAMDVFDREIRGRSALRAWTEDKSYEYAIEHDGKLYPVKKIASIASFRSTGSAEVASMQTTSSNECRRPTSLRPKLTHLRNAQPVNPGSASCVI